MSATVEEIEKTERNKAKKTELLLDSLEIKGYRCFEHLTIEKLARVNLIVGKNNVGKTALLEALWIYLGQGNVLHDVLISRFEDKLPISFSGNANITYKAFFNRSLNETTKFSIGPTMGDNPFVATWNTSQGFEIRQNSPMTIKNVFVKTDGLNNQEITGFWDKIELTPTEDAVTKSMRLILPNLLRVRIRNVQNGERVPYAQVENLDEPLTLKSFGEGLNKLFGISLALANCKDGVLLIDEIENGFHYSVLPEVWKLIFNTAKELNVQVFVTTHSKDCIDAFANALNDSPDEGMLTRLERHGEKIVAKSIAEDMLVEAVNYEVEVR